ncbi:MAG: BON domain-containing protein [Labilithrix sp.]|nr:BON domain-containing protein [Labilithrix sp.]MCW5811140.1 BON domain-containing protein [Labilithrix sp.]
MSWSDRTERERYATPRIEHDPDVERRDRIREIERLRSINQSPWAIGVSHWNQRDLYTRNSRIDEEGYGRGPALHPEDGSYAYHRDFRHDEHDRQEHDENGPTLHEREAWPWLNYTSPKEDPYFAHLDHDRRRDSFWQRLKGGALELLHAGKAPKNAVRADARILEDVNDALTYRGDLDATDIDVTVHAGEVTLTGTVTDRRSKRIAEEVAEGVLGVRDVHNQLTIRKDDPSDANVAFVLPLALLGRGI